MKRNNRNNRNVKTVVQDIEKVEVEKRMQILFVFVVFGFMIITTYQLMTINYELSHKVVKKYELDRIYDRVKSVEKYKFSR